MIRHAFKEWAAICRALGTGEQAVILRKGGIAEVGGTFRPDHARFWLFPTYLHQKPDGLTPAAAATLAEVERDRPPAAVLRLTHYVEVPAVFRADRLDGVLALAPYHVWSEATVRQRFEYRGPGLFVLPARVYAMAEPIEVPNRPEYDGCKTWVDFGEDRKAGGTPVLSDEGFADVMRGVARALASGTP